MTFIVAARAVTTAERPSKASVRPALRTSMDVFILVLVFGSTVLDPAIRLSPDNLGSRAGSNCGEIRVLVSHFIHRKIPGKGTKNLHSWSETAERLRLGEHP